MLLFIYTSYISSCISLTSSAVITGSTISVRPVFPIDIAISISLSKSGYPIDIVIINLSICASGRLCVPALPYGFCVAITIKGSGTSLVIPSTDTFLSSMTSRRADCVLGDVLFISSASSRLQNTLPG